MSFTGEKELEEIHESRPEVLPRIGKSHTTPLLITQHTMQDSKCFAKKKDNY